MFSKKLSDDQVYIELYSMPSDKTSHSSSSSSSTSFTTSCLGVEEEIPLTSVPLRTSLPRSLSSEEYRCVRCDKFYKEDEKDEECHYHPGTYVDPRELTRGLLVGWSCCRFVEGHKEGEGEVNERALKRGAKGCTMRMGHKEDTDMTEMMRMARGEAGWAPFEIQVTHRTNTDNQYGSLHIAPRKEEEKKKEVEEEETEEDKKLREKEREKEKEEVEKRGFVVHKVQKSDTLFSLSLRYDVTVEQIKSANMISSSSTFIQHHPTLRIPTTKLPPPLPVKKELEEERKREAMERAFLRIVKGEVDRLEAKYYLEESDWDLTAAVNSYKESTEWEKTNPLINATSQHPYPPPPRRVRICC